MLTKSGNQDAWRVELCESMTDVGLRAPDGVAEPILSTVEGLRPPVTFGTSL
jgi:hypothetical protein